MLVFGAHTLAQGQPPGPKLLGPLFAANLSPKMVTFFFRLWEKAAEFVFTEWFISKDPE